MSAHTPGPWSMWTSNSVRRISAVADGDVLCAIRHDDGCADLYFKNGGCEGQDARLILAAPDLLDALRECCARLSACRLIIQDDEARHMAAESVNKARAAIDKAT